MNFKKFLTSQSFIFPVANSTSGGQLLTEYNQLSKDTVATSSNIKFRSGPSYTHSKSDFLVDLDSSGDILVHKGTAVVDGHYLDFTDTDPSVDVTFSVTKAELVAAGLSGELSLGLLAVYDNDNTLAATLKPESSSLQEGIQVVVCSASDFKTPSDVDSRNEVTAHLKLCDFTFENGAISNIVLNDEKITVIDAERISNMDQLLESKYVSVDGLNSKKLYSMTTNVDPSTGDVTPSWKDSTGSLISWDASPQLRPGDGSDTELIWLKDSALSSSEIVDEAVIRYDRSDDKVKMVLPHQAKSGDFAYKPKELSIPTANRATGSGGVLDSHWVNFLNGIDNKISTIYRMPGGKMRKFIDVLSDRSQLPQPPIAYYTEQTRSSAYYDNRLQYSFNLLQTQVAQLSKKFTDFQNKLQSDLINSVTSDVVSSVSSQTTNLQSDVASIRQTIAGFQSDISTLTSSIQGSSAEIQALVSRVSALEAGDPPSDPDILALRDKVDQLSNQISSISASVNTSLTNASSTLDSLYQSLYGPSGDVTGSNTSIEQLRSQYDYLYQAVRDLYNGVESIVQEVSESSYDTLFNRLRTALEADISAIAEQYNVTVNWAPGDYVLVAQDQTVTSGVSADTSFPSTMYVVVPGMTPLDSKYVASYYDVYTTDLSTPINQVSSSSGTSSTNDYNNAIDTYNSAVATIKRQVPARFVYGYELGGNDVTDLASEDDLPDVYNSTEMLNELYNSNVMLTGVRGVPGKDYFVLRYRYPVGDPTQGYVDELSGESYPNVQYQIYRWVSVFFTLNLTTDKIELDVDNPIILSGGVPYAENERVGGFLNVNSDVLGAGYVSRDDAGHLRLNDFELLAAGTSAYQLGEDRSEGAGLDISELQNIFDQYVNQRIAWPNANQLYRAQANGLRTDVITIDLNIGSTAEGRLNIYDIDSRFNTAVHLKISGSSTENVVIQIDNCQRLRISLDQTSSPSIILRNTCLYYDADIIDKLNIVEGLTLWYDRWEDTDPYLEVDGMTVIYQGSIESKGIQNFWSSVSSNDNLYAYGLRQLTFASDGTIIGLGVAITDNTTNNIMPVGQNIFAASFVLPQSIGLPYPVTRMTKQLKVTGNFITAYYTTNGSSTGYSVKKTTFTMMTQKYLSYPAVVQFIQGNISFYTDTTFIPGQPGVSQDSLLAYSSGVTIDGWEPGSYHIFYGGSIE